MRHIIWIRHGPPVLLRVSPLCMLLSKIKSNTPIASLDSGSGIPKWSGKGHVTSLRRREMQVPTLSSSSHFQGLPALLLFPLEPCAAVIRDSHTCETIGILLLPRYGKKERVLSRALASTSALLRWALGHQNEILV